MRALCILCVLCLSGVALGGSIWIDDTGSGYEGMDVWTGQEWAAMSRTDWPGGHPGWYFEGERFDPTFLRGSVMEGGGREVYELPSSVGVDESGYVRLAVDRSTGQARFLDAVADAPLGGVAVHGGDYSPPVSGGGGSAGFPISEVVDMQSSVPSYVWAVGGVVLVAMGGFLSVQLVRVGLNKMRGVG